MQRLDVIDYNGKLGPVEDGAYVTFEDAEAAVVAERERCRQIVADEVSRIKRCASPGDAAVATAIGDHLLAAARWFKE